MFYAPNTSLAAKLAAGVITAGALIGATFPAAGQQVSAPFSAHQCRLAQASINQLLTKYRGRMSAELAQSFGAFASSNCDMNTTFNRRPRQDDDAFGEFNLLMVAIRRTQVSSASPQ